jgi:AcrR family transcriptional regulator
VSIAEDLLAPPDTDGRRARRDLNRRAVVEALLELYREGQYDPSSTDIAVRAGLSPRSLFRYFDDVDDLARAAVALAQEQARPLVQLRVTPDHPLDRRIRALAESRANLWDSFGPAARAARMRAPLRPVMAADLAVGRAFLRKQVRDLFGPELAQLGPARASLVAPMLEVACSFETYDQLRSEARLSRARAVASISAALGSLLAPPG